MNPILPRIGPLVSDRVSARGGLAGRRINAATGIASLMPPFGSDRGTSVRSPPHVAPGIVPIRLRPSADGTTWLTPFATPTLSPNARRHLASSLIGEPCAPEGHSPTTIEAVAEHLPSALQTLRAGLRFDAALRSAPLTAERALRLVEGPQDYALCRLPKELQHERMTDLLRKLLSSNPQ